MRDVSTNRQSWSVSLLSAECSAWQNVSAAHAMQYYRQWAGRVLRIEIAVSPDQVDLGALGGVPVDLEHSIMLRQRSLSSRASVEEPTPFG